MEPKTVILGIIGNPVEQSLSPAMHNAALMEMGLDWVYVPFPVAAEPPERLQQAVNGLAAVGVRGFSVTIPHRQAILPLLSELLPEAEAAGAVNTVKRTRSGWVGDNTDVHGFIAPLQGKNWSGATAVVLGNGGAARAVVVACGNLGMAEIWVVGSNQDSLNQFAASFSHLPTLKTALWQDKCKLLPLANLLVNATPIGMKRRDMNPDPNDSPLTKDELDLLQTELVYDLVYTPRLTRLLQQARSRGLLVHGGLQMLVQQGAAALAFWTKEQTVPVATMLKAVLKQVNLYLIGMPGSGKTRVGQTLADLLGCDFVDTDVEVKKKAREHNTEESFRQCESQVLARLCANPNLVIATGGGIILRQENLECLRQGVTVWLDATNEIIHKRLETDRRQNNRIRLPFRDVDPTDWLQKIKSLRNEREQLYKQAADIKIEISTEELSELEIATRIVEDALNVL